MLFQVNDQGEHVPINFASRVLNTAEINYTLKTELSEDSWLQRVVQEFEINNCRDRGWTPVAQNGLYEYLINSGTKLVNTCIVSVDITYIQHFCVFMDKYRTVAKIIGSCLICAQAKAPNRKCKGMMGHVLATEPLEIACVDLFGPLPKGLMVRGG
ncbi:hypothetical protein PR048_008339 [Dryococelus australis]|uniref:Integrase zinc-binding domain-containing protein n=1 Tax=Dryococelus australis TaxID=614101 RepID=A0ABQ9HWX6_9NEOP|nr:hypothetical protein PR048_008339 [Dryococelus australis]